MIESVESFLARLKNATRTNPNFTRLSKKSYVPCGRFLKPIRIT